MVVFKSKSSPNLLFYASTHFDAFAQDGDSVSSLDVTHLNAKSCYNDGNNRAATTTNVDHEKNNDVDASVIGTLLWKLLLTHKMSVNGDENDWEALQKTHVDSLSTVSIERLQEYHRALTSIVILDETIDDRAKSLLEDYHGKLVDLRSSLTNELKEQGPETFTAFVADFNDNLAYSLERDSHRGMPSVARTLSPDQWNQELQELEDTMQEVLPNKNSNQEAPLGIQGSFLKTENKSIPQPAHVDFAWQMLTEQGMHLWLAFFGLTQEGMILQLWPSSNNGIGVVSSAGQLVFVPLGKMLIMPSDTIHGGGFRTRPVFNTNDVGNLRYHLYLATDGHGLPQFVNNTYTQKDNRRRDLSDLYQNAPGLVLEDNTDDGSNVDNNRSNWESSSILMDLLLD